MKKLTIILLFTFSIVSTFSFDYKAGLYKVGLVTTANAGARGNYIQGCKTEGLSGSTCRKAWRAVKAISKLEKYHKKVTN